MAVRYSEYYQQLFQTCSFTTDSMATVTQEEEDDDDDIPLAQLAGINFREYANVDSDIPCTKPLTDDDIINQITDTQTTTEQDSDDDELNVPENPIPTLASMTDMTETYQSYFEAQDDTEDFLPLVAKLNDYFTRKQLKKKLNAKQTTLTSDFATGLSLFRE